MTPLDEKELERPDHPPPPGDPKEPFATLTTSRDHERQPFTLQRQRPH
jgi:hypothetical protein